jgi:hypothetical protein
VAGLPRRVCGRIHAVAFAIWNPVGIFSLLATVANVGLVAATLMPWTAVPPASLKLRSIGSSRSRSAWS